MQLLALQLMCETSTAVMQQTLTVVARWLVYWPPLPVVLVVVVLVPAATRDVVGSDSPGGSHQQNLPLAVPCFPPSPTGRKMLPVVIALKQRKRSLVVVP